MPGMMDTILNIGLTRKNFNIIKLKFGAEFAYNSYLRLLECYSDTVLNLDFKYLFLDEEKEVFIDYLDIILRSEERLNFNQEKFQKAIDLFEKIISNNGFEEILDNIEKQIEFAIKAVIHSYYGKRAVAYRSLNNLDDSMGTAIVIQSMVFGNLNHNSGTGVVFSRNPSKGENKIFGEFMICAQGEDVVSGVVTPGSINSEDDKESMMIQFPEIYFELESICKKLEEYFKDVQDIEFTVENKKLYILQSRSAKRSANAEMKIALDFFKEGKISENEMINRINYDSISKILHPVFDQNNQNEAITRGLAASPGCAVGSVFFDANDAKEASEMGKKVILVRTDTSPEDIIGMIASEGILTSRGGMTSHAAVVARGMGKPCVCGALEIFINASLSQSGKKYCEISRPNKKKIIIEEGDIISINGGTGEVFLGEVKVRENKIDKDFEEILKIAQKNSFISIRANADTEEDCIKSLEFGCKGIGLCRTEHMFFNEERIFYIRKLIICDETEDQIHETLFHIKKFQKDDFKKIFSKMEGLPVTIRLLDPPLHEFLPLNEKTLIQFAKDVSMKVDFIRDKVDSLSEKNPMLGHRGCRLGISFPEIYMAQIESIFDAIFELIQEKQDSLSKNLSRLEVSELFLPEIMIPLVAFEKECEIMVNQIHLVARKKFEEFGFDFNYKVGSMIELPRAVLISDKIARHVDFISFGTNDLTQTTLGISRDDMMSFLNDYNDHNIFNKESDPFTTIDECVADLIKKSCDLARSVKPDIKIGVCGEHGGDPRSIKIFKEIGLTYVSTSPYRIPSGIIAISKTL